MTHTIIQYGKSLNADTDRAPSPALWGNCPILEFQLKGTGFFFHDDFQGDVSDVTNYASGTARGPYITYQDTGVLIDKLAVPTTADSGLVTGELEISVNDSANDQGHIGGPGGGEGGCVEISDTAGSQKEMWFEARFRSTDVTDGGLAFFLGLGDEAIIADQALTDADGHPASSTDSYVGFHVDDANGDSVDTIHSTNAAHTVAGAAADVLVVNTYTKYGLYFDGTTVYWYINGVKVAPIAGVLPGATNFPDAIEMTMCLLTKTGNAAEAKCQLDWWRVAQRYATS